MRILDSHAFTAHRLEGRIVLVVELTPRERHPEPCVRAGDVVEDNSGERFTVTGIASKGRAGHELAVNELTLIVEPERAGVRPVGPNVWRVETPR